MKKSQDVAPVWNALGIADPCDVLVEAGREQGFLGPKVGRSKPLLQAVNAQHQCRIKRWTPSIDHWRMRSIELEQFGPERNVAHLIEQD